MTEEVQHSEAYVEMGFQMVKVQVYIDGIFI